MCLSFDYVARFFSMRWSLAGKFNFSEFLNRFGLELDLIVNFSVIVNVEFIQRFIFLVWSRLLLLFEFVTIADEIALIQRNLIFDYINQLKCQIEIIVIWWNIRISHSVTSLSQISALFFNK